MNYFVIRNCTGINLTFCFHLMFCIEALNAFGGTMSISFCRLLFAIPVILLTVGLTQNAHGFNTPIYKAPSKLPYKSSGDINVQKLKLSPALERHRTTDLDTEAGDKLLTADSAIKVMGPQDQMNSFQRGELKDIYGRQTSRCADHHVTGSPFVTFDSAIFYDSCTKSGTLDAIKKYVCQISGPNPEPSNTSSVVKYGDAIGTKITACTSTQICRSNVVRGLTIPTCVAK